MIRSRSVSAAEASLAVGRNNLHFVRGEGQEATLLAGLDGIGIEFGDIPIVERERKKRVGKRCRRCSCIRRESLCGFFARDDSVINFLLAEPFPCLSPPLCSSPTNE